MRIFDVLKVLEQLLPGSSYLVGGCVRDILLDKKFNDVDLVAEGSAVNVARRLAGKTGAKAVLLDSEHDVMRIVTPEGHIDLTGLNGKTLINNLKNRDFTVNALAVPLKSYLQKDDYIKDVIDPLGGIDDLYRGVIRACSSRAFEEDPLRILRAVRLKASMGFILASDTIHLMNNLNSSFSNVAGERVWEELRYIFNMEYSYEVLRYLDDNTSVLDEYFPEIKRMRDTEQNYYHADNVWKHSLKTLYYFEYFLYENILPDGIRDEIFKYLECFLTRERKRLPIVKLACLFHDIGKLKTRGERNDGRITFYNHHKAGVLEAKRIGSVLKLSNRELYLLQILIEYHMQPLFLYKESPPSNKAITRFFRNLNVDVPGCLLLSLSDVTSSRISTNHIDLAHEYYNYIKNLLLRYYKVEDKILYSRPFLTGEEICEICNISPSPLVGELKDYIMEAQIEGKINNREEAEKLLKNVIKNYRWQE